MKDIGNFIKGVCDVFVKLGSFGSFICKHWKAILIILIIIIVLNFLVKVKTAAGAAWGIGKGVFKTVGMVGKGVEKVSKTISSGSKQLQNLSTRSNKTIQSSDKSTPPPPTGVQGFDDPSDK